MSKLGQIAYEAYAAGMSLKAPIFPTPWLELSAQERSAWQDVAAAVVKNQYRCGLEQNPE
jgi:hypothetical protein